MIQRIRKFHRSFGQFSFTDLGGIAIFIFGAGNGFMYFVQRFSQWRIQQHKHYKEAIAMFEENELAKEILGGEPIRLGRVDILFNRKRNFVGQTESRLRIPVIGSETGGFLNLFAIKGPNKAEELMIETLELEVDGGNRYMIFDRVVEEAAKKEEKQNRKRPRLTRCSRNTFKFMIKKGIN